MSGRTQAALLPPADEPAARERLVRELGGRDLACWCPLSAPCHADVLLELANAQDPAERPDV